MHDACSADLGEILARVAGADDGALSDFYDCTNTLVFGLVQRILYDPAVAEEVTLDVYMQVWRQAKQYDARRAAPRTWLLMIARSRAIDSLRSSCREVRNQSFDCSTLIADSPSAEETLSARDWQVTLRSAMDCLTPNQHEAIEMAFYGGMTHSAIASKLRKPLGTVKSRIRLGMLRLRGYLETHRRVPNVCPQIQHSSAGPLRVGTLPGSIRARS
ncbi:MAG: sigma-70 family RNA polymerase sigma factor [Acidobacteriota bacterium]|nr:sigma-70 family RNA polymerase sigma factor [Acidobacteriota bacterium]